MALTISKDQIIGSNISTQATLQGLLSFGQYDRAFIISGLDDESAGDPSVTTSLAYNKLQATCPLGSVHPNNSLCTARNYQIQTIADSSDSVRGIASYVYNQIPVDSTVWTIDSDTYLEQVETDVMYDSSGNLVPIAVDNYILGWTRTTQVMPTPTQ